MDYKEKIRLAKEALDSGSYDKETIEYIFPELKESEDERIRKEIIEYIKTGTYHKSWIDWLEKQGEFKNIDSDDLATLETWEDAVKENKEKWQLSDWFVKATSLLIQKVKRIENNESINIKGSRVMLNACINALRNVGHSHLSNWLEKQSEQKPFDVEEVNFFDDFRKTDSEVEQKPTEWSEEDEETLKDIITSMTNLKDSATSDALRDIYNSKIDWLKSLSPKSHWKPSDNKAQKGE